MALLNQQHITFHVGMPKSASTTLQEYFNAAAPEQYLGHENRSPLSEAFLQVVRGIEVDLSALAIEVNEAMGEKPWLFSSEFGASYWTPLAGGMPQSVFTIADRLFELAPNAQVLIILRNPLKMVESLYAQLLLNESYALSPGALSYERWLDRNIQLTEKGWPSAFDLLNYPRLLRAYGKFEHLEVRFLEDIGKDFEGFVNGELVPKTHIEMAFPFVKSVSNTRHSKGEIRANRRIKKWLNSVKRTFPALVNAIPQERRKSFEKGWQNAAGQLPGDLKNPKCREDQKRWMQKHFEGVYEELAPEIKAQAKALGYPVR